MAAQVIGCSGFYGTDCTIGIYAGSLAFQDGGYEGTSELKINIIICCCPFAAQVCQTAAAPAASAAASGLLSLSRAAEEEEEYRRQLEEALSISMQSALYEHKAREQVRWSIAA